MFFSVVCTPCPALGAPVSATPKIKSDIEEITFAALIGTVDRVSQF